MSPSPPGAPGTSTATDGTGDRDATKPIVECPFCGWHIPRADADDELLDELECPGCGETLEYTQRTTAHQLGMTDIDVGMISRGRGRPDAVTLIVDGHEAELSTDAASYLVERLEGTLTLLGAWPEE